MSEEILYNQMYEKTADCGRTQFVRLLMDKERENQQLKEQLEASEKLRKEAIEFINDPWILSDYKIGSMLHDYKTRAINILDIDKED